MFYGSCAEEDSAVICTFKSAVTSGSECNLKILHLLFLLSWKFSSHCSVQKVSFKEH